jgi:hypothetical protein
LFVLFALLSLFVFVVSAELLLFVLVLVFVFRLPRRLPRFFGVLVAGADVASPVGVGVVASSAGVVVAGVLARLRLDPLLAVLPGVNENFCGDPGTDASESLSPERRIRNEMVAGGVGAGWPAVEGVTCPICIATPV